MTRNDPNPKERATYCPMCGGAMPRFSKAECCSSRCRKRKSRLISKVGETFLRMNGELLSLCEALDKGWLGTRDVYQNYRELRDRVDSLVLSYNQRFDREIAQEEAASAKRSGYVPAASKYTED